VSGDPADPFHHRLSPAPDGTARCRAELRRWLRTIGASDTEEYDILTATGEAIANAIEHPLRASRSLVVVTAITEDGVVQVSVRDCGRWQPNRQRPDGGYGLTLMRSLMDTVNVLPDQDGTTVVMGRTLRHG
jgi:anti-sigma regulatory factor (Ser/Thr protein kinase)